MRSEFHEVLEVGLRQRGGVADRLFRRDRAVGLHREREPVIVGALAHAGLGHRTVRAADRIVDGVDPDEIHGKSTIQRVLVGLDVSATLVDVQLDVQVAIVLQRQDVMPRIDDTHAGHGVHVASSHRAHTVFRDAQHGALDVVRQGKRERLEIADDLMDVLDHAGDRLVFVHDAVDADAPNRRAAERR